MEKGDEEGNEENEELLFRDEASSMRAIPVFYARAYACVTSSRLVTLRLNRLLRSR